VNPWGSVLENTLNIPVIRPLNDCLHNLGISALIEERPLSLSTPVLKNTLNKQVIRPLHDCLHKHWISTAGVGIIEPVSSVLVKDRLNQ
jgi:hypothetical protein